MSSPALAAWKVSAQQTGPSIAVVIPGSAQVGDMAVVSLGIKLASPPTVTPPTGWSSATPAAVGSAVTLAGYAYFKEITSGDIGATATWAYTGTAQSMSLSMQGYRGAGLTVVVPPVLASNGGTAGTPISYAAVTPTDVNDTVIALCALRESASGTQPTFTPPTGYTTEVEQGSNSLTTITILTAIADKTAGSTSSTGVLAGSCNVAANTVTALLVLSPSSAPPPAVNLQNTGEGWANGATITAGGTGSGSPFDVVTVSGGATLTASTASPIHGTVSYAVAGIATGTVAEVGWNTTSITNVPQTGYNRVYGTYTGLPTGATDIALMAVKDVSGVACATVRCGAGGVIKLRDSLGNAITGGTATSVLTAGQKFRIETQTLSDPSVGQVVMRIYLGTNLEGALPDETVTTPATQNTNGNPIGQALFAQTGGNSTATIGLTVDDVGFATDTWLGATGTPPPPVFQAVGWGLACRYGGASPLPIGTGKFGIDITQNGWTNAMIGGVGTGTPTLAQVHTYLVNTYFPNGTGPYCKFFSSTGWTASYSGFTGTGWGAKPNERHPTICAKTHDATQFNTLMTNMATILPAGETWQACFYQEPEDNFADGSLSITGTWNPAWQSMATLRAAHPNGAQCKFVPSKNGYTENDNPTVGPQWNTFTPISGVQLDVDGWDVYDQTFAPVGWGFNNAVGTGDGKNRMVKVQTSAAANSAPWALTEMGINLSNKGGDTVALLIDRLTTWINVCVADPNFRWMCYWMDANLNGLAPLNNPTVMAILQTIIG